MDHITRGQYNYPGRLPEDDIVLAMSDGLKDTIAEKIQEFMERQDELFDWYAAMNQVVESLVVKKEFGSFDEWFWTYYIEVEFVEYAVINKWIRYYLNLAKKIQPEQSWTQLPDLQDKYSNEDIARAKQHPIEDLFEGKLRQNGSRFLGLCPFHKEKTGSFVIFSDNNSFYCFGCHKHGDSIDFYMATNKGVTLRDALRALS